MSKPRADFYADHHPTPDDVLLVIEVSDTTLKFDRQIKLPLYAKAGIPEVWTVDITRKQVICHTRPEDGTYRAVETVKHGETLSSVVVPVLTLKVEDVLG